MSVPPHNQRPGRYRRTRRPDADAYHADQGRAGPDGFGGQRRMPHADPRRYPVGDAYDEMVPRQGYTVPYRRPPAAATPTGPGAWLARYRVLRQRAQASSMSWWLMKVMQGLLAGGPLFLLGIAILVANVLAWRDSFGFPLLGGLFVIVGLVYIVYHGLAPWLHKWIVSVPDKHYQVVVVGDNHPVEYLPPGRLHVPFRFNSRVIDYVNFTSVHTKDFYPDVLQGYGPRIDLEVGVMMDFNPVEAQPETYQQLFDMNKLAHFRRVIADTIYEAVWAYLGPFSAARWVEALRHQPRLARYLTEALWDLAALGLKPAGGQPVTVFVHGLDAVPLDGQAAAPVDPYTADAITLPPVDRTQPHAPVNGSRHRAQDPDRKPGARSRGRRPPIGLDDAETIPPFEDGDLLDFLAQPPGSEDQTVMDETVHQPPSPARQRSTPAADDQADAPPDGQGGRSDRRGSEESRASGARDAPPNTWIRPPNRRRDRDER